MRLRTFVATIRLKIFSYFICLTLVSSSVIALGQAPPQPQTPPTPSRADILRGEYGYWRANNDLLSYDLDIRVDPEKKFISGNNTIRFKMLKDDTRIQLDLFANLKIDKILLGSTELKYTRELGTVFVDFPEPLKKNSINSIEFHYSGYPQETGRFGGISFRKDPAGRHWITTACQGTGASVWWPNKDQQQDEVENMRLRVSIPSALTDVSNGRLLGKNDLGDGYTRYDWVINYPINNYCVSLNIGHYETFSHKLDDLTMDYLRPAGKSGEGQTPVRPGQADDVGVSKVFRRLSVQAGWLQADRSSVFRDGASERCHIWQSLRKRLSRTRLDGGRSQPEIRLHYRSRKRARMVRQQHNEQRHLRYVDSGRLGDLRRSRLCRGYVRQG